MSNTDQPSLPETHASTPGVRGSELRSGDGLGASAPTVPDKAAIERQMRYLCETNARMSELKIRTKNAKHWIGRRLPAYADDELMHLAYEAEKLRLHLRAWNDYVIPSPNIAGQPRAGEATST